MDVRVSIPRAARFDESMAFRREGYTFISARCDALDSDVFETRLFLRRAYCLRGPAAAELFYSGHALTRTGGMPKSAQHLLQDVGSVQDLDNGAHTERKSMFLPMLEADAVDSFAQELGRAFETNAADLHHNEPLRLNPFLTKVLTKAGLSWSGIPEGAYDLEDRRREFTAMIDNAGSFGVRNWAARLVRRRSERWAAEIIDRVRRDELSVSTSSMVYRIATHRQDGELLDLSVAGEELLNVLRPIVAISRFAVFAAMALWQYPQWREHFAAGHEHDVDAFVHEVRRFYPFFPAIGARVRTDLQWQDIGFHTGDWLIFDLYGTNHDRRVWPHPDTFQPERFSQHEPAAFEFVPQGGGQFADSHRCPGERLTIAAMKYVVLQLSQMHYSVPAQDLSYRMSDMPALPQSEFVIVPTAARDRA